MKALVLVAGLLVAVLVSGLLIAMSHYASPSPIASAVSSSTSAEAATPTAQSPQPAPPPSSWDVSSSNNDVTGAVTTLAVDGFRDNAIVVRKRGHHLELYVETPDFLETTDNIESRNSKVAYKFDNGPVVRQYWTISDDNTALFYPGNPARFLKKLAHARSFAFQYEPSEKVPKSETFDVAGFPEGKFIR